jgi:hypothetical protein
LASHNVRAAVEPLPVRLLYGQPYMLSRGLGREKGFKCANAERLMRKGFALSRAPRRAEPNRASTRRVRLKPQHC